jgi:integrase
MDRRVPPTPDIKPMRAGSRGFRNPASGRSARGPFFETNCGKRPCFAARLSARSLSQSETSPGLANDPQGLLFRTIGRGTSLLTRTPLPQANAYAMIQRRARATGIRTRIGNHAFRATGITAYLKTGGTLEKAALIANHASTRATQLYDRRSDEVSLDEVERILI